MNFKDTLVAEVILAVIFVTIYVKAGRSWDGVGSLAIKYHWPGAKAFQDLFVPGLRLHSREIAWSLPFVAIFIACGWNWPIGGYTVFTCSIAYSYLVLGPVALIPIILTLGLMYYLYGYLSALYGVISALIFTLIVLRLALWISL
jgi:hypothetical protein